MRRSYVPFLLLALTLTGCSSSKNTAEPSATFTPPTVETDSPTPSPTPTASPTPSPTPSPTATATPVVRGHTALPGDVDGDGIRDSVRATAALVVVELSSGGTVSAPVHADTPRSPAILGYADVDRDGRSEIFVETAEGASTQFVTPYRYDGKALHEIQLDDGPARLGIGGSVAHGEGFRCTGGQLVIMSADSADGKTYTVHIDNYRLTATRLVHVSGRTVQAKQSDPLVGAAYQPDCGTVGN